MRLWACVCIIAISLVGCGGGGGGSSTPSASNSANSGVQQVAVQQALVQQSLSSLSSLTWITLGSSTSLAIGVRRAMSGSRRFAASCSDGVNTVTSGNTITISVYTGSNCTGTLVFVLELTVTQSSATAATATGSETFYTSGGSVYEYVNIANFTISTGAGAQYFSIQASVATSSLSAPYQNFGVGCSTATSLEICSVAVANHIAALNADSTSIESETVSFSASGTNTVVAISGSGSAYTGPLNSTTIGTYGPYNFIIQGGTLVYSANVAGSFTIAATGALSAASLTITADGGTATVSFNGSEYAGSITAANGTSLATFDADGNGNGTVTYSNGNSGTISDFSIVSPTSGGAAPESAFTCPTSDTPSSAARAGASSAKRMPRRAPAASSAASGPSLLAVTYDRATFQSASAAFARAEQNAGATLAHSFDFAHAGRVVHVLSVSRANLASAQAALRAQAGVLDVSPAGQPRYATTVNNPYWPNNPYFNGFTAAQIASQTLTTGNPTYHVGPYEENATIPGQWDMHAIGIENAFGYSVAGNSTGGVSSPRALGSSTIKLAIIDTGEDPNHPELSQIAYQKCFITSPGNQQSSSNFEIDPDGHGTDVAGIADATLNTGIGFVGAGGLTSLYAYRVFPTPDDTCSSDPSAPECGAQTVDIASAIEDAVAQHVNIISMSLGGGGCTGGVDSDPVEGAAVADALAANIIVIAASGNDGAASVDAPACDSGVIAAGATALDDGALDGSNHSGGSASTPVEYVTGYSNYGSPAADIHNGNAWGIVAPGGDPAGENDADQLHWIENIWTSTPFASDDAGNCDGDFPSETGTPDCRVDIAGTSMAAPHVAGVAALVLAVGGGAYQSPATMKNVLCQTADQIGDPHEGCGRVNAYRAVATVLGDSPLP